MTSTSLGPRDDLVARLCPVVACYDTPGMFAPHEVIGVGQVLGIKGAEIPAGGYLTTIDDLHRFASMLRNGGELGGVRILSPRTLSYCTQNFTGDKSPTCCSITPAIRAVGSPGRHPSASAFSPAAPASSPGR
jgi:CubicO group peptidase (beta-lactamase class C family)